MFLGIDIGTTATKAILLDSNQKLIASATTLYELQQPAPGISEIDPIVWLDGVRSVINDIRRVSPIELSATRAIGLSGQMHSVVLLDKDQLPIRSAILWNDGRGKEESERLSNDIPGIGNVTGVVPMPSFSASKLLWVKRNQPDEFARIHHVLWAKDYVRHWLTGEFASDMSDAGGSQLLDQQRRRWSDTVVNYIGLKWEYLPRLLEGTEASGILKPELASELGLPKYVVVAAGGGDTPASALGLGCIDEGTAFISLGTGAVFVTAQEAYRPQPETLLHTFAHCVPERWYRMAAMLNGASCLSWAARLCNEPDIGALLERVESRGSKPGRVLFQPYLRGERTPHNDVSARGAFVGLDADCDSIDLAKAVLEGVAFSLRQGHELLTNGQDTLAFLGLIGGGARSVYWSRLIATVLGRPVAIVQDAEFAGAIGSARLAMVAAGAASVREVATLPSSIQTVDPDLSKTAIYSDQYQTFTELYPALRPFTQRCATAG